MAITAVSVALTTTAVLLYQASLPGTPVPTRDWGAIQTYAPANSEPHVLYKFEQRDDGSTGLNLTVELDVPPSSDSRRPQYVLVTLAEAVMVDQLVADGDVLAVYDEPDEPSPTPSPSSTATATLDADGNPRIDIPIHVGIDWDSQGIVLKTQCKYRLDAEECGPQIAGFSASLHTSVIVNDRARYSVVVPTVYRTQLCPHLIGLDDESAARYADIRGTARNCFGNAASGDVDVSVGPVPHALRIDDSTPAPVVERGVGREASNRLRWYSTDDTIDPVVHFVDLAEEAADQRLSVWAGVVFGIAAVVLPIGPQLVWHARPRRRTAAT